MDVSGFAAYPLLVEEALRPDALGIRGAVGRVLSIAFLAELDGSWSRFKGCSSPTCRAVFWDRSRTAPDGGAR